MQNHFDFSGWATRNNIKCSDGRTIRQDAFKDDDGIVVPLVWNHQHDNVNNVLGHALLENRKDGVYAYGTFNDTEDGRNAKLMVQNGDITMLSIYANKLKQNGGDVIHGAIREVSLVLAGANPGAKIESVMAHGENAEEEAYIRCGERIKPVKHSDEGSSENGDETMDYENDLNEEEFDDEELEEEELDDEEIEEEYDDEDDDDDEEYDYSEEEISEIIDSLDEDQCNVINLLIEETLNDGEDLEHSDIDEDNEIAQIFDSMTPDQQRVALMIVENEVMNIENGEYDDYDDYDEELEHADEEDEEGGETVGDVFKSMNKTQKKAVYALIELALRQANGEELTTDDAERDIDGNTIEEVFNTLTNKQKNVAHAMIGQALENNNKSTKETNDMKHNVFENDEYEENVLSHSDMEAIFSDAKRFGSLKEATLQHGIENIEYLYPNEQNVTDQPTWLRRDDTWVKKVLDACHRTPFSRIRSVYADITADDARAKGYVKGNLKAEEFFSVLKRATTPVTIYKKQKIDKDDMIDITDFDVVAYIKTEMRIMLNEELARAVLVGDGRDSSSADKISESNIRPIWTDNDVYTIKKKIQIAANAADDQKAKAFIRAAVKARTEYKGSGNPTLYTTEDVLTTCLLMEDANGRVIYDTEEKLRTALRVKEIVTVPSMEGLSRTVEGETLNLWGIVVNLDDYNIGMDKGGAVNMFDDFDINYNANLYLIETRCSGALIKPYSAIALEMSFQ